MGAVYAFAPGDGEWIEPGSNADMLGGYVDLTLLVDVWSSEEGDIVFLGAVATDGTTTQDPCAFTEMLMGTYTATPSTGVVSFEIGPQTALLPAGGDELIVEHFVMKGMLDGTSIDVRDMRFTLDTRNLGVILEPLMGTDDPDEICGLMAGFDAACGACDDGNETCIDWRVEDMDGSGYTGGLDQIDGFPCR